MKRPYPFRRECGGKRVYRKHEDAVQAARMVGKRASDVIAPYRCSYGNHWHNGHAPEPLSTRPNVVRPNWRTLLEDAA